MDPALLKHIYSICFFKLRSEFLTFAFHSQMLMRWNRLWWTCNWIVLVLLRKLKKIDTGWWILLFLIPRNERLTLNAHLKIKSTRNGSSSVHFFIVASRLCLSQGVWLDALRISIVQLPSLLQDLFYVYTSVTSGFWKICCLLWHLTSCLSQTYTFMSMIS